jgi:hypothetical protein
MEPDLTDPFGNGGGGSDGKSDESIEPGWWVLVGGVWRWMTSPPPAA